MTTIPYLLATAGHVDHGKSTLVRALTGIDPDRLPEEKARGITIDLGFAPLWLPHPESADARLQVGIVDVPGHEDFITTMAAGTAAADAALLVVAANEGWMPQTQEHFEILQYQHISRLFVAITKADIGDPIQARHNVENRLSSSRFAASPIVPVSATTGAGMQDLRTTLARMLLLAAPRPDAGKPRLFIDRVFSRPGLGTIVTGSLTGGSLAVHAQVRIEPLGHAARIRSLHTHGSAVDRATPSMRAAANLPDVPAQGAGAPRRGDVLLSPACAGATGCFDAALWRLASAPDAEVRNGIHVRIQAGTQDVGAKLLILDRNRVAPGESALAQFRCERPVSLFLGDSFVVRDWSKRHTLAGGRVLLLDTPRHRMRTPGRLHSLARISDSIDHLERLVEEMVPASGAVRRDTFLLRSPWSSQQIAAAIEKSAASGRLTLTEEWICQRAWIDSICAHAAGILAQWHDDHPREAGMPMTEWKAALGSIPAALITHVVEATAHSIEICNNRVRLQSHRPQLPAFLAASERRLREDFARHPFDPPSRPQLAPDLRSQQALEYLLAIGDVIAITPTVLISREAFQEAVVRIRQFLKGRAGATVAELKQMLGSNRRVMVPLLEMLDVRGITRRKGDVRILAEPPAPSPLNAQVQPSALS